MKPRMKSVSNQACVLLRIHVPVCHHATREALLLVLVTVLTDGFGLADPDITRMFILAERMRECAAAAVCHINAELGRFPSDQQCDAFRLIS